jgi:hypothetical protein
LASRSTNSSSTMVRSRRRGRSRASYRIVQRNGAMEPITCDGIAA